jgi:hypothetical protein
LAPEVRGSNPFLQDFYASTGEQSKGGLGNALDCIPRHFQLCPNHSMGIIMISQLVAETYPGLRSTTMNLIVGVEALVHVGVCALFVVVIIYFAYRIRKKP